jgi:hypothetical protein
MHLLNKCLTNPKTIAEQEKYRIAPRRTKCSQTRRVANTKKTEAQFSTSYGENYIG